MVHSLPITEEEANRLIEEEKEITEEIKWRQKPQHGKIFEFVVPLQLKNNDNARLTLVVNRNTRIKKFSFTILYNGTTRIKSLDIGKGHKNPPFRRKNNIGKKHKHTWTNRWKDTWAYVPDDITDGANFDQVLQEFFVECNIKCNVEIPSLPSLQEELILDDDEMYGDHGVY